VFAKVGKKVIADDGVHGLEALAGSYLFIFGGIYRGFCWERRDIWGRGGSDWGHGCWVRGETIQIDVDRAVERFK